MPESLDEHLPGLDIEKPTRRGIFSESGKCLIEAPPKEMLENYHKNHRVEYFPAQVTGILQEHYPIPDDDVGGMIEDNQLGILYSLSTIDPLTKRLAQTLGDGGRVGIRGTVCSIDGEINEGEVHVKDLLKVLDDGTEKNEDRTRVATYGKDDLILPTRTTQWLVQSTQELRQELEGTPESEKLYPVLLVYDLDCLTPLDGLYGVQLPPESEDRAKAITKAYILDYPKARQELSG